jgi:restriction system protein
VVTSGRFTQEAIDFAAGRNIELIDGPQLETLIREVGASKARTGG